MADDSREQVASLINVFLALSTIKRQERLEVLSIAWMCQSTEDQSEVLSIGEEPLRIAIARQLVELRALVAFVGGGPDLETERLRHELNAGLETLREGGGANEVLRVFADMKRRSDELRDDLNRR